jgi:hypothetical protein
MVAFGSDRALALWTGYAATDWHEPLPFARYCEAMRDWDVVPVESGERCIGAAYFRAGEVHVSILPAFRKKWACRGFLAELFKRAAATSDDGVVTTRVTPGHEYMAGIMERLGFVVQPDGSMKLGQKHGH